MTETYFSDHNNYSKILSHLQHEAEYQSALESAQDREDVVQEAAKSLWMNRTRFRPELSNQNTWMNRVIASRTDDRTQANKAREKNLTTLQRQFLESGGNTPLGVDEIAIAHVIIESIDFSQHQELGLYVEGYSYQEIVDQTGQSMPYVKTRIRRSREQLKKECNFE